MKRFLMAPVEWLRETWGLQPGELGDMWVAWDIIGSLLALVAAIVMQFFK